MAEDLAHSSVESSSSTPQLPEASHSDVATSNTAEGEKAKPDSSGSLSETSANVKEGGAAAADQKDTAHNDEDDDDDDDTDTEEEGTEVIAGAGPEGGGGCGHAHGENGAGHGHSHGDGEHAVAKKKRNKLPPVDLEEVVDLSDELESIFVVGTQGKKVGMQ